MNASCRRLIIMGSENTLKCIKKQMRLGNSKIMIIIDVLIKFVLLL